MIYDEDDFNPSVFNPDELFDSLDRDNETDLSRYDYITDIKAKPENGAKE